MDRSIEFCMRMFDFTSVSEWVRDHRGPTGPQALQIVLVLFGFSLLFHEPLHGVHHLYAGLPSGRLPAFVGDLPAEGRVFPSYRAAVVDLLRDLGDPRVGSQWDQAKHRDGRPRASDAA